MPNANSIAWLITDPQSAWLGHGPFREQAEQPQPDEIAFYIPGYGLDHPKPWKIPARVERLTAAELREKFPPANSLHFQWNELDSSPFANIFLEVMEAIRLGQCEKTVPVVVESGTWLSGEASDIAAHFLAQASPCMAYGWINEQQGFAGATPESLLSLQGNSLKTMALAGTAKREEQHVFAVDCKEIREHEYVVQSLLAKLSEHGNVQRGTREILNLGSIVHFYTPIEVELHQPTTSRDPASWIRRLHPTPALGPLPRTPQTLDQLINWRTQLGCPSEFGAPFGVWDHGRFEVVVMIRGMWWNSREVRLPAGCGVIEASRLVNEWRELRLKREAIKAMLAPKNHLT